MVDGPGHRDEAPYADEQEEMFRPLREHRAFIIAFVLSAMLSALVLTYIYSERFLGETTIFFKPADITRINEHTTEAFGSPFPTTPFKVISQTISGLVSSDSVLRRVVVQLHLDRAEPKDYSGPWYMRRYKELKDQLEDEATDVWKVMKWGRVIPDDPVDKAVETLRRHVKVRNDDSYVFTLRVTDKTPQRAAADADALAASLVEALRRDVDRFSSQRIADMIEQRTTVFARLQRIEEQMRSLLAANDMASVQQEAEKATARSAQLLQAETDTQADLRQSEQKAAGLAEKLRLNAPPTRDRDPDAPPVRRSAGLTAEDYNKLYYEKLSADVATSGLRARLDSVKQSIAAVAPHLRELNQVEATYDELSAELQSAKRDYIAVTDALQELLIKGTSDATELRIQNKAEIPEAPVSPIKIYHVGLAGVLAALIACGLAYVLDFFRIRLFLPRPQISRPRLGEVRPVVLEPSMRLDAD